MHSFTQVLRALVLGDRGVGKTTMLYKFSRNEFNFPNSNIIDIHTKRLKIELDEIKVMLFDYHDAFRYPKTKRNLLNKFNACILVFDLTNAASFESIESIYNEFSFERDINQLCFILFGTKKDLETRAVDEKSAIEYAASKNMPYTEISSLTGEGIDDAVTKLVKKSIRLGIIQEELVYDAVEQPKGYIPCIMTSCYIT